jgi:hypothetical protein
VLKSKSFGGSIEQYSLALFLKEEGLRWEDIQEISPDVYMETNSYGQEYPRVDLCISWYSEDAHSSET